MAVYKVPQDVEAEDKLIGPFSFRQFIYLMVAALGIFIGVVLFQIFPGLVVIPLPIVLAFLALALPLRKDQPMETYLLALIRFYLKPRNRIWNPDGTLNFVEITAPKIVEQRLTKDISQDQAREKLDYLARVMDSRGWAVKGIDTSGDGLYDTVNAEASTASDIMDEHADLARSFDTLIAQKNQQTRVAAMQRMHQTTQLSPTTGQSQISATQTAPVGPPAPAVAADPTVHFNPYPSSMHQQVIQPLSVRPVAPPPTATPQTPMPQPVSPAIMNLANNNDLSISAIAHEAHRLADQGDQEVVISLR